MAQISLCMISKNEAASIGKCLTSVFGLVDEIIIADTGSTDDTISIAKSHKAKIVKYKWNNNFSDARNFSLSYASCPWILVLDADEVISSQDFDQIKEMTNMDAHGFFIPIRNYTNNPQSLGWRPSDGIPECEQYKGYFITSTVRLFRNDKKTCFKNALHETVNESIIENKGTLMAGNVPIHHYGYSTIEKNKDKTKMYLAIALSHLKKNPEDGVMHHEVGMMYKDMHEFEKAEHHLKQSINYGVKDRIPYNSLGHLYFIQNKSNEAIEAYSLGVKANPQDDSSHNNLGVLYRSAGEIDNSIKHFRKAIHIRPHNPLYYESLALSLIKAGKVNDATFCLQMALKCNHPNKQRIISLLQSMNTSDIDYNFSVS